MADHVAEAIVDAAKTVLTGLTTTGANVFDSQVYPITVDQTPALLIDQGDEEAEVMTQEQFPPLDRSMELIVVAAVKQTTGYRTLLNKIRAEVEIALATNPTIGGARAVFPTNNSIELSGDADAPVARSTMRFNVRYITALNAPGSAI